jgi:AcrR family transcriptional regulator
MASPQTSTRHAERKHRDKEARRAQIIRTARQIAEAEGWPGVTVRRLSEEIAYSQPVLYSHFSNREAILAAVAIEGFRELGLLLEQSRTRAGQTDALSAVATAYLDFAAASPALYQAMFTLNLELPFDQAGTPSELRFAFDQLLGLFSGQQARPEVLAEVFWANLHGIAELSQTRRLPPVRQKERLETLVQLFRASPPAAS